VSKKIQITLPDETYELLEQKANAEKIKVATLATAIIRRALEKDGKKKRR
jgi:hypothetical protein